MKEKVSKPYDAVVLDSLGVTLLHQSYGKPQEARRKVCREMAINPLATGKVIFTKLLRAGKPMEEVVPRNSAMMEVYPKSFGAVLQPHRTGNIANVMRARNSHASFSRG